MIMSHDVLTYYLIFIFIKRIVQVFAKAVVPTAIRFAAPTGKRLKEKDLEFCRRHTRFDDKERKDFPIDQKAKTISKVVKVLKQI